MKNRTCFFIFSISLFIFSCTKELPLPAIETQPRIVVNAAFSESKEWSVQVSKSTSIATPEQPSALSSASVFLKDASGNIIEELIHGSNGNYISANNTKPIIDQTYHIEVSANGFTTVDATGRLPHPVDFTIDQTTTTSFDGEIQFKVDFKISDDGSSSHYYIIESFVLIEEPSGEIIKLQNELSLLDSRTDNASIGDGTDRFSRIYLQDNTFNGQFYETEATLYSFIPEDIPSENYKVFMLVKSVEESLYNYFKSFDRFKLTGDEPFAEPVQVYTNVNNGLGIFGGFSIKEIEL
ncbi:MAG: DUF4249 domain-containing protein [Chitinophagales bacterium]|nr:DUF4249 domain-containing protein [Chitinophagales bacterium]